MEKNTTNFKVEISDCQKSHNKVTKTVYVWFELLWIRRYSRLRFMDRKKMLSHLQLVSYIIGLKVGLAERVT